MLGVAFGVLTAVDPLCASDAARPEPKFLGGKPDQQEGAAILEGFRNVGVQGDYWLKFELRVMPHRGAERVIEGQMFGAPGPDGPFTRIVTRAPQSEGDNSEHYLLHGGAGPRAWRWKAGLAEAQHVTADDWLAPVQETDLTLFDLQMPFLRWKDFVYEGIANVRGRPAHAFILYPPAPPRAPTGGETPVPAAIRVFLDTQFNAMTQAEWLDAAGKPMKTVTVLDLKKVQEQWLVKSIDLRNHATRAKTRLAITEVALGLDWPNRLFTPEHMTETPPNVPRERRVGF